MAAQTRSDVTFPRLESLITVNGGTARHEERSRPEERPSGRLRQSVRARISDAIRSALGRNASSRGGE